MLEELNGMNGPSPRIAIACAIARIKVILKQDPEINQIIFSCDEHDHTKIGTNIFKVNDDVKKMISTNLMALQDFDPREYTRTHDEIDNMENKVLLRLCEYVDRVKAERIIELERRVKELNTVVNDLNAIIACFPEESNGAKRIRELENKLEKELEELQSNKKKRARCRDGSL